MVFPIARMAAEMIVLAGGILLVQLAIQKAPQVFTEVKQRLSKHRKRNSTEQETRDRRNKVRRSQPAIGLLDIKARKLTIHSIFAKYVWMHRKSYNLQRNDGSAFERTAALAQQMDGVGGANLS